MSNILISTIIRQPEANVQITQYNLCGKVNIFTDGKNIYWLIAEEVKGLKNPFVAGRENEPVLLIIKGKAIIELDTLILLYADEVIYTYAIDVEVNLNIDDLAPWTQTKYFLDFISSTPSLLQECATGNHLLPEDDGVAEIMDKLKPAVNFLSNFR